MTASKNFSFLSLEFPRSRKSFFCSLRATRLTSRVTGPGEERVKISSQPKSLSHSRCLIHPNERTGALFFRVCPFYIRPRLSFLSHHDRRHHCQYFSPCSSGGALRFTLLSSALFTSHQSLSLSLSALVCPQMRATSERDTIAGTQPREHCMDRKEGPLSLPRPT